MGLDWREINQVLRLGQLPVANGFKVVASWERSRNVQFPGGEASPGQVTGQEEQWIDWLFLRRLSSEI